MKIFISMPMNGKTEIQTSNELRDILNEIKRKTTSEVELVDSILSLNRGEEDAYKDTPIYYLGYSIQKMAEADLVVFAPGWSKARGCKIEHQVAEEYGKLIIDLEKYDNNIVDNRIPKILPKVERDYSRDRQSVQM